MQQRIELTIGEVAQLYCVPLQTLRFYEERSLLTPRQSGQSRYYSERDETRLQMILKAKRLGFTLFEIARIIDRQAGLAERPVDPTVTLARSQIEAQIALLVQRRAQADAAIDEPRLASSDQLASNRLRRGVVQPAGTHLFLLDQDPRRPPA